MVEEAELGGGSARLRLVRCRQREPSEQIRESQHGKRCESESGETASVALPRPP